MEIDDLRGAPHPSGATLLLTPWPPPCGAGGVGIAARDTPPVLMLRNHSSPHWGRGGITKTVPPLVTTQHSLCPNTGELSTPTPLPSVWAAHHINNTSSCCPSILNPTRTRHPRYTCSQIQVRSAQLYHSHLCGMPITHIAPHHVVQASSIPHERGTQHSYIVIPKEGCTKRTCT